MQRTSFIASSGTIVYAVVKNSNGCKQIAKITLNLFPIINIVPNSNHTLCDDNFDGITSFNLDDAKNQISTDVSATFKYYKDAAKTQSISTNYTNETAFAQTVYGTVTSTGFCPTDFTINLTVNIPTKSSTLKDKYEICYGETLPIDAGAENVKWEWSDGQTTQTAN